MVHKQKALLSFGSLLEMQNLRTANYQLITYIFKEDPQIIQILLEIFFLSFEPLILCLPNNLPSHICGQQMRFSAPGKHLQVLN